MPTQVRYSPLWLASSRGHKEVIRVLLAAGAKLERREDQVGPSAGTAWSTSLLRLESSLALSPLAYAAPFLTDRCTASGAVARERMGPVSAWPFCPLWLNGLLPLSSTWWPR